MTKDQYAVAGNPIAHSKSPVIHALFARQTGQNLDYRTMLIERGDFAAAVDRFRQAGGRGLNITVPFKQDACAYADCLSQSAERAGAVNTLVLEPDRVYGDNTDGRGLVRDLTQNYGARLSATRILLLGAGGAARGALQPLLAEQPRRIVIANRTLARAQQLVALFADLGAIESCALADLGGRQFDLIINATAASLDGELPELPETLRVEQSWCYDMMYADQATAFVRWGQARGAVKCLDGLGMLVEQAAESFAIWRGVRPETAPVIKALRGG